METAVKLTTFQSGELEHWMEALLWCDFYIHPVGRCSCGLPDEYHYDLEEDEIELIVGELHNRRIILNNDRKDLMNDIIRVALCYFEECQEDEGKSYGGAIRSFQTLLHKINA
jgi:hypothetical protein